jgi:20S proteasome alpha/beta subunit
MSLIVALQGKDGLVLGADSRGPIGDPRGLTAINDDQVKLFQLSKFCGIGVSGASEFAAKVIDELKRQRQGAKTIYTDDITEETRQLVRRKYDDWFAKFKLDDRPSMTFTIVGYQKDGRTMRPRTYLLVSRSDFAPHLFPTGNCLAGIPQYAVYLMHRFYDPAMTVANLASLAAYLISETATQDPKVGGQIRVATITTSEGYKELPEAEIAEINKKNSAQNDRLKKFFLAGN